MAEAVAQAWAEGRRPPALPDPLADSLARELADEPLGLSCSVLAAGCAARTEQSGDCCATTPGSSRPGRRRGDAGGSVVALEPELAGILKRMPLFGRPSSAWSR
jgi:hypothetical protein